jgi:hypothetical protein
MNSRHLQLGSESTFRLGFEAFETGEMLEPEAANLDRRIAMRWRGVHG